MGPLRKASTLALDTLVSNRSRNLPSLLRFIDVWKPEISASPELTVPQMCQAVIEAELEKAKSAFVSKKFSDAEDSYTAAIAVFEKAKDLLKDDPSVIEKMADVYAQRGKLQYDKDAALIDFETAKSLSPRNTSGDAVREAILIGKGKLAGTRFEEATIRFPEGDTIPPIPGEKH